MYASWRRTCTALRPSRCRLVLWNRGTLAALQPHFGPLASLLASCGGGGPFTPLDSASLGRKGWDRALTLLKIPTPLIAELDAAVFAAADDVSLTFGVGAAGRTAVELPFLLQAAVWASLPDGSRPPARWLRWQPRPLGGGGDDLDVTGSELAARVGADADGAALLGRAAAALRGQATQRFLASVLAATASYHAAAGPALAFRVWLMSDGAAQLQLLGAAEYLTPIFSHYAHGGKVGHVTSRKWIDGAGFARLLSDHMVLSDAVVDVPGAGGGGGAAPGLAAAAPSKKVRVALSESQAAAAFEGVASIDGAAVKGSAIEFDAIDLDGTDAVASTLAAALTANQTRVMDIFRKWDANHDGIVSRDEFGQAVTKLGIDVATAEVDELWATFDKDRSGSVDFREVQKNLFEIAQQQKEVATSPRPPDRPPSPARPPARPPHTVTRYPRGFSS